MTSAHADQLLTDGLTLQTDQQANLLLISDRWAQIKYAASDHTQQQRAMTALEHFCSRVVDNHPGQAEALAWHGQVIATLGEFASGMGALKFAKQALPVFQASVAIDERALEATAHISLGVLYYEVPGWPLGFGNRKDALKHLSRALVLYPDDIEAHFYYAGYLEKYDTTAQARKSLEQALALSENREDRTLAIEGRQLEIKQALAKLQ